MRWLAVILMFVVTPAFAELAVITDSKGNKWIVPAPPAKYATMPDIGIIMHFQPRREVYETCQMYTGKVSQFGCAVLRLGSCDVYVINDLPQEARDVVYAHETAHCKGWPGDHPTE